MNVLAVPAPRRRLYRRARLLWFVFFSALGCSSNGADQGSAGATGSGGFVDAAKESGSRDSGADGSSDSRDSAIDRATVDAIDATNDGDGTTVSVDVDAPVEGDATFDTTSDTGAPTGDAAD